MKLQPGHKFEVEFQYDQSHVDAFMEVTGDYNPVHHDEEYAAGTIFKRPIIHGFLSASVFSKVFGTEFPGQGTIYLSQNLKFLRPMYVNEPYKAVVEVQEIIPDKNRGVISTVVMDRNGEKTIAGEAVVFHRERF
jgi:acyl dehydratase